MEAVWLQNSSFNPSLFKAQQNADEEQELARRSALLAEAETSDDDDASVIDGSRKRMRDESLSKEHRKLYKKEDRRSRKQAKADKVGLEKQRLSGQSSTPELSLLHCGFDKRPSWIQQTFVQKLAHLDARARIAGPRVAQTQLVFSWAEDAERMGLAAVDCLDAYQQADNLVYEKPYLMNIPAYRRILPRSVRLRHLRDNSLQKDPRRKQRRRFSTRGAKLKEMNKATPRLRLGQQQTKVERPGLSLPHPTFIPLLPQDPDGDIALSEQQVLQQKTTELNRATMDRPESVQAWLDFAEFQDTFFGIESAAKVHQARLSKDATQKKIDILQRALRHHPHSERVMLALMRTSAGLLDIKDINSRWQEILRDVEFGRSWRLWQAYIHWLKSVALESPQIPTSVSSIRDVYNEALKAVQKGRLQLLRQQATAELKEAEAALVNLLVAAARFDLQSGYTEQGVARIQAALEYALLAPTWSTAVPGPGGDAVRRPLFEMHWSSGVPLIGESGAVGWQEWVALQQTLRIQQAMAALEPEEEEPESGGWSGWQEIDVQLETEPSIDLDVESGSDADEDAVENILDEETEQKEAFLEAEIARLGEDAPEVVQEWLHMERYQERCVWQPQRPKPPGDDEGAAGDADDESAEKVILFESIEAGVFSLGFPEHKHGLVLKLLQLLDAPFEAWQSSNDPDAITACNSSQTLSKDIAATILSRDQPGDLTDESPTADATLKWLSPDWLSNEGDSLTDRQGMLPWYQADKSRQQFLVNVLGLLSRSGALGGSLLLCRALVNCAAAPVLQNEDPAMLGDPEPDAMLDLPLGVVDDARARPQPDVLAASKGRIDAVREAVSELLRGESEGSPLWAAYAEQEATHGSIKKARKTFNMLLLNSSRGEGRAAMGTASLALSYARAEVRRKASDHVAIALHVLSWAACPETPFEPFDSSRATLPDLELRLARARMGFQRQISQIASSARGGVSPEKAAVISAAALYEELADPATGLKAAAQLLRNATSEFPLEVRQGSAALEALTIESSLLLERAESAGLVNPRILQTALDEALQVYPASHRLLGLLCEVQRRAFLTSQMRLRVKMASEEHVNVPVWLLAARLEASQVLALHQMRQLFQRAERHEELVSSPLWQRVVFAYSVHTHDTKRSLTFSTTSARCAWVKDLCLWDGFVHLGKLSLRLKTAEEKGIRFRVQIDQARVTAAARNVE